MDTDSHDCTGRDRTPPGCGDRYNDQEPFHDFPAGDAYHRNYLATCAAAGDGSIIMPIYISLAPEMQESKLANWEENVRLRKAVRIQLPRFES